MRAQGATPFPTAVSQLLPFSVLPVHARMRLECILRRLREGPLWRLHHERSCHTHVGMALHVSVVHPGSGTYPLPRYHLESEGVGWTDNLVVDDP